MSFVAIAGAEMAVLSAQRGFEDGLGSVSLAPLTPMDYELLDELRSQVERLNEKLASESAEISSMSM